MSRVRGPTKCVRIQLDFVIVLPRETSSIPIGEREDIHPVLVAAWKACIARIRKGPMKDLIKPGDEVMLAGHGKMRVGLDNRPVKAGQS